MVINTVVKLKTFLVVITMVVKIKQFLVVINMVVKIKQSLVVYPYEIYSLTWRESSLILTIKSFLWRELNETKRDTRFVLLQQENKTSVLLCSDRFYAVYADERDICQAVLWSRMERYINVIVKNIFTSSGFVDHEFCNT